MKITEARELARKKWGPLAFARKTRITKMYAVGKTEIIGNKYGIDNFFGTSKTSWEDAFLDADKKASIQ